MVDNNENYYHLWQTSCYGVHFYQEEIDILKSNISNLFGFHILQIGAIGVHYFTDLAEHLKINHKLILVSNCKNKFNSAKFNNVLGHAASVLYSKDNYIPLETASIDAVLLAHALEFSPDPHGVLREVDRILLPEGHLIILGFNPWSFWGIRKFLNGKANKSFPWDSHSKWFSSYRVCDWLTLLNYRIKSNIHFFYRPCINNQNVLGYTKFFERIGKILPIGAAGFCIIAIKKQESFTLVRSNWQPNLKFARPVRRIQPSLKI